MQIQVNSETSPEVDLWLSALVEANVNSALRQFDDRITRVEIHLRDVDAKKSGHWDIHCLVEAQASGDDSVVVTEKAATMEAAVQGAAQKMQRLLDRHFECQLVKSW